MRLSYRKVRGIKNKGLIPTYLRTIIFLPMIVTFFLIVTRSSARANEYGLIEDSGEKTINYHSDTSPGIIGATPHHATGKNTSGNAPKTVASHKLKARPFSTGEHRILVAQAAGITDTSTIIVQEGVGFMGISVRNPKCDKEFIKSKLGPPEREMDQYLGYDKRYRLNFFLSGDATRLTEIRLNRGFKGRLSSNVSLSTPTEDVFKVYGKPLKMQAVDDPRPHFADRTLYVMGNRSKIYYNGHGLLFWFTGDRIDQIVIHRKRGKATPINPLPPPKMAKSLPPSTRDAVLPDVTGGREHPLWGPLVRVDKLRSYVNWLWVYWYCTLPALLIAAHLCRIGFRKLYYRWRPLPEGRLLIMDDPTGGNVDNINIWYEARRLKKRQLLIGSGKDADIRLPHDSVDPYHALILARRFEGGARTYIKAMGSSRVTVNGARNYYMPLVKSAEVRIGELRFRYEEPNEYRQVQVRYKSGRVIEGVPASWDIDAEAFLLIPSKAASWNDARMIRFGKLKGVYFVRDWDEDIRTKLLRREKRLHDHPATLRFRDNEELPGYLIGDYKEDMRRFYFFPEDQSGDTVYILVERSSIKSLKQLTQPSA